MVKPFTQRKFLYLAFTLSIAVYLAVHSNTALPNVTPVWGTDSRIIQLKDAQESELYLYNCREANIFWHREFFPDPKPNDHERQQLESIIQADGKICAVFAKNFTNKIKLVNGVLTADLKDVYEEARNRAYQYKPYPDVWELANEPDLAFFQAMPDQYASWAKSVYLALKSSPDSANVIMGSMGLPPGTYLERLAHNGGLFYTEAFNQHYYGHPHQFNSMIDLVRFRIRDFYKKDLTPNNEFPIWITECGFRTGFNNSKTTHPGMRDRQARNMAAYTQAAIDSNIAVFMPFCLHILWQFALFDESPKHPFPAWHAYTDITKRYPSHPERRIFKPIPEPSPVVLQWRPAKGRCIPHKISGSYRFMPDRINSHYSMSGHIRLYNFSDQTITGNLRWEIGDELKAVLRGDIGDKWFRQGNYTQFHITILPHQHIDIPFLFSSEQPGFFRSPVHVSFTEAADQPRPGSLLHFNLESPLRDRDFEQTPIYSRAPYSLVGALKNSISISPKLNHNNYQFHYVDLPEHASLSASQGPWVGLNHLEISPPAGNSEKVQHSIAAPWRFTLNQKMLHPNRAPTAITKVYGLPQRGFIRIKTDRPMETGYAVRVDLIDKHKRRFTVYEWFGLQRGQFNQEAWLNLEDFHPYCWGKFSTDPFNPADVREIQLRFHINTPNEPVPIQVEFLKPRQ